MRASVSTINGKKPIGHYDRATKTYSKWIEDKHRLWKAGGAICIDRAYLDEVWPQCEFVEVLNKTTGVRYVTSVFTIRKHTWTDPSGHLHQDRWGEQYALQPKYWAEQRILPEQKRLL
jgi:hypothetical protein